jgi:hypothetical protein
LKAFAPRLELLDQVRLACQQRLHGGNGVRQRLGAGFEIFAHDNELVVALLA